MSDDFEMEVVKNDDLDSLGGQRRSQEQSLDVQGEAETSITSSGSRVERQTEQSQAEAEAFRFDEIPHDWSISFVSEVAKGNKGLVDGDWIESKDMDEDGQIQLVQLGHIGQGEFKGQPDRFITREFAEDEGCTILSDGDLLISRMQEPILRSCLLPEFDRDSIMAVDIARLRETEEWNRYFLMYLFNSRPIWRQGIAWASGTTRKRISRKNIEKIRLQKPPLDEQRKIASVLYTVDQAIQKTEAIIEQAKRVKRGLVQKIFLYGLDSDGNIRNPEVSPGDFKDLHLGGFEERLMKEGRIPQVWSYVPLEECLTEFVSGAAISSGEFSEEGFPVVAKGDVTGDEVIDLTSDRQHVASETAQKYSDSVVNSNYVVVSLRDLVPSAPTVGSASFVDAEGQFLLAQGAYGLLLDEEKLDPKFFVTLTRCHYFRSYMKRIAVGSTQVHVRSSEYKSMRIPLPPIKEQRRISALFEVIDGQMRNAQSRVLNLRRFKRGLMQDLLTGEVRTADKAIEVLDEVEAHG